MPGAWTTLRHAHGGEPQVVKVYHTTKVLGTQPQEAPGSLWVEKNTLCVATGQGVLSIDVLQVAGKKRMLARDFINGYKNIDGAMFE